MNVLVTSFRFIEYLCCGSTAIINNLYFQCLDRLKMQILTYKDGPALKGLILLRFLYLYIPATPRTNLAGATL